ncbi:MAG: hypothetical protein BHV82_11550 [Odoribacter sp. 43_10]|nr:MAG: hypothetical protein BHV82_11550 [Odoribacter sp. 43_10]
MYIPDFFTFYDDIYCFIILPVFIFYEYVRTNELHGHKLIKIIFYKNIFLLIRYLSLRINLKNYV